MNTNFKKNYFIYLFIYLLKKSIDIIGILYEYFSSRAINVAHSILSLCPIIHSIEQAK